MDGSIDEHHIGMHDVLGDNALSQLVYDCAGNSVLYRAVNHVRLAKVFQLASGDDQGAGAYRQVGFEDGSQGFKARFLRGIFDDDILTPDFRGSFDERMGQLKPILGDRKGWIIVGSSFGGLMGTVFSCQHPDQVKKLILLAPALVDRAFEGHDLPPPASVSTTIYHGQNDDICPLPEVRKYAEQLFTNLNNSYFFVNFNNVTYRLWSKYGCKKIYRNLP